MPPTLPLLAATDFPPTRRRSLDTLQVNLGYKQVRMARLKLTIGLRSTLSTASVRPSSAAHWEVKIDQMGGCAPHRAVKRSCAAGALCAADAATGRSRCPSLRRLAVSAQLAPASPPWCSMSLSLRPVSWRAARASR